MTDTVRKVNRLLRPLFLVGGVVLTVVGVIGLVTPGWPGTIFLILAAGCFARSSPRLEAWLLLVHLPVMWTVIVGVSLLASALYVGSRPEGPKAAG